MTPRDAARVIWDAALAAGDVRVLVERALRHDVHHLLEAQRIVVLGCGKASAAMAHAAEDVLGDRITGGFVVVKDGYTAPTRRVTIAEAGHPVPDARGEAAADRLLALARDAGSTDRLLFLASGGGSALTPAPAAPVTLAEKQEVTRLLLASGATINELNAVRKHLSRFKGGQLARAAAPASIVTLALSDVIGDPLDVIASGPTAPDPTTFADALAVLDARKVRGQAPASVVRRLEAGVRGEIAETPKPGDPLFRSVTSLVIGNNAQIVPHGNCQNTPVESTDAAGALVDGGTLGRGGQDARQRLDDNDAHTYLERSGDLIITGATNTNLLDLYLVLRS